MQEKERSEWFEAFMTQSALFGICLALGMIISNFFGGDFRDFTLLTFLLVNLFYAIQILIRKIEGKKWMRQIRNS